MRGLRAGQQKRRGRCVGAPCRWADGKRKLIRCSASEGRRAPAGPPKG